MHFDIYWNDLTPETQRGILIRLGLAEEDQIEWDLANVPIGTTADLGEC